MSVKVSSNSASTRRVVAEERLLASRNAAVEGKVSIEREVSSIVDDLFIDANVSVIIEPTLFSDAIGGTNCRFRRRGCRFGGAGGLDQSSQAWNPGKTRTPAQTGGPPPRTYWGRDDERSGGGCFVLLLFGGRRSIRGVAGYNGVAAPPAGRTRAADRLVGNEILVQ